MADLDLATAKWHMRVDSDHEDGLIDLYVKAAQEQVAMFLNRNVYDNEIQWEAAFLAGDTTGIVSTSAIDAAVLLIAASLHENRTDSEKGEIISRAKNMIIGKRLGWGV